MLLPFFLSLQASPGSWNLCVSMHVPGRPSHQDRQMLTSSVAQVVKSGDKTHDIALASPNDSSLLVKSDDGRSVAHSLGTSSVQQLTCGSLRHASGRRLGPAGSGGMPRLWRCLTGLGSRRMTVDGVGLSGNRPPRRRRWLTDTHVASRWETRRSAYDREEADSLFRSPSKLLPPVP